MAGRYELLLSRAAAPQMGLLRRPRWIWGEECRESKRRFLVDVSLAPLRAA